jgi:hypothetical protein
VSGWPKTGTGPLTDSRSRSTDVDMILRRLAPSGSRIVLGAGITRHGTALPFPSDLLNARSILSARCWRRTAGRTLRSYQPQGLNSGADRADQDCHRSCLAHHR